MEIQHIPSKVNPADHLSRQSILSRNLIKNQVRAEHNKLVECMRILSNSSSQQIQSILIEMIQRDQGPRTVQSILFKFHFDGSIQTELMNGNCKLLIHRSGITMEDSFKQGIWES